MHPIDTTPSLSQDHERHDLFKKLADLSDAIPITFLQNLFHNSPLSDLDALGEQAVLDIAQFHYDNHPKDADDICLRIENINQDYTIIDIISYDTPFYIDSICARINSLDLYIAILVHRVTEDNKGIACAHMHMRLKNTISKEIQHKLQDDIPLIIHTINKTTKDWSGMREHMSLLKTNLTAIAQNGTDIETQESIAFLDYLYNDNFTFLGMRHYQILNQKSTVDTEKDLGVFALTSGRMDKRLNANDIDYILQHTSDPVVIFKLDKKSVVHRRVPMDAVLVRHFDEKKQCDAVTIFVGLFTSVTYSRSISDIPILRQKAQYVIDHALHERGVREGGYSYKTQKHILEKYPRDELLQISKDDLRHNVMTIATLQERRRIALFARKHILPHFISCMVYIPRDRYGTTLRMNFQNIIQKFYQANDIEFYTNLDDSAYARVLYLVDIRDQNIDALNADILESTLQKAGETWPESLYNAMAEQNYDADHIDTIIADFANAFPVQYRDDYDSKTALRDIEQIQNLLHIKDHVCIDIHHEPTTNKISLSLYHKDSPIILANIMPIFKDLGLFVESETPYQITLKQGKIIWMHRFLARTFNQDIDLDSKKADMFESGFLDIIKKNLESDGLNALILLSGLQGRQVMTLRAYTHYLKQIQYPYDKQSIITALTSYPEITKLLNDYFTQRFDPNLTGNRTEILKEQDGKIQESLKSVSSLVHDRILRMLLNLIQNTLRTNYYVPDHVQNIGHDQYVLSLKFDSHAIQNIPEPKPYREIFVYSPDVEAVHLRNDEIARGGIRWSDRPDDFRTEILGLVKAQQVKNSVIVPMGAKGGFVVKNPSTDRQVFRQQGIDLYKIFIRSLLDITDSRQGDKIIAPQHVVRHDQDDPYLVVAADKGTASFSDTANGISAEYDFWLGDAFASGGSAGYDHKAMGITAKGAWECVKRHFREQGHDTQTQPFTVIGVGDMAGDVFGNGMILSDQIRLLAAFNHVHIFIDPNPDCATSFTERKRLFSEVKGWESYNQDLLSKGGRIFERSAKILDLTPEIKDLLSITQDQIAPEDLMKTLLQAKVDLLWFGGIGTYIKAESESHADVGDKANDMIRVNATQVQAKTIGEGANLGVTHKGRIEYALAGGAVNADFIDNSGGVDCSDHEVNIKILLNEIMKTDPKFTRSERDLMLEKMTPEVSQLVLKNNYQQSMGISLMQMNAPKNLTVHAAFIRDLERDHGVQRHLESFPEKEEIEKRGREGKGLTRPELSTLQAYAKILLTRDILSSDIPDDPYLQDWLYQYFPKEIQERFGDKIPNHRLKRAIIATEIANNIVNRMGSIFIKSRMDSTKASCADVVRAYLIVLQLFDIPSLWREIEALDGVAPAHVQLDAMNEIIALITREVTWFLKRSAHKPDLKIDIAFFDQRLKDLFALLPNVLNHYGQDLFERRKKEWLAQEGMTESVAQRLSLFYILGAGCDIVKLADRCHAPLDEIAISYFAIGQQFMLGLLRQCGRNMDMSSRWEREAIENLIDDLYQIQAELTETSRTFEQDHMPWKEYYAHHIQEVMNIITEIKSSPAIDLPMLLIAQQQLRGLIK